MNESEIVAALAVLSAGSGAVALRVRDRDRTRRRIPLREHRRRVNLSTWITRARAIAAVSAGWWIGGVAGVAIAVAATVVTPRVMQRRRAARRAALLEDQLSDAVASVSAGLRAGMSVLMAIDRAAIDVGEPLGTALRDIVRRTGLGVPLRESLTRFANQIASPGARLVATTLAMQHRYGGDGPKVLDRLADTLRQRADGEREITSLTAQARLSGTILGLLPVAFFLFLMLTSRDDLTAAYRSPPGAAAIVAGVCMQATAFVWIRRLLRVET